jgi:hypothetical protein
MNHGDPDLSPESVADEADAHEELVNRDWPEDDWDDYDPVKELHERWEAEEAARSEGRDRDRPSFGVTNPLQGIVRVLGRDALRIGMTLDVEHGTRRQVVEIEIVDIHPKDNRLATVERTDGKKWDHDKTHTRIVRP